jgi:hypothetical protein
LLSDLSSHKDHEKKFDEGVATELKFAKSIKFRCGHAQHILWSMDTAFLVSLLFLLNAGVNSGREFSNLGRVFTW